MKLPDEVQRDLVGQWVGKAEQDLAAAEILLKNATRLPSVIAFHAQQAVEKYLKAILDRHQIYFPKTHDLGKILDLVAACEPVTAETLQESRLLTPFGTEGRYPGDTPELLPATWPEVQLQFFTKSLISGSDRSSVTSRGSTGKRGVENGQVNGVVSHWIRNVSGDCRGGVS